MVREHKGTHHEPDPEAMSAQDMAIRLLELIAENRAEEEQMRKILKYALKVFAETPGHK